jgi:hypothetical protein
LCDHDSVIDKHLFMEVKDELMYLVADELVSKINHMCEISVPTDIWDNPKISPYEHMYNNCALHLVPVGINPGVTLMYPMHLVTVK